MDPATISMLAPMIMSMFGGGRGAQQQPSPFSFGPMSNNPQREMQNWLQQKQQLGAIPPMAPVPGASDILNAILGAR